MPTWRTQAIVFAPEPESSIREAIDSDAPRIAALAVQLGYEVPLAHVKRQLGRRGAGYEVFVAVVPRVGVVGWAAVALHESLLSSKYAELEGLIVEDEYRGNGIGRALLARVERFAHEAGAPMLRVHSNVVRERAHAFYEREGYRSPKSQQIFEKHI